MPSAAASSRIPRRLLSCIATLSLALASCTDVTTPLIAAPTDSGIRGRPVDSGAPRDGGDAGDAAASLPCDGHACACDDGKDQDGDLLVDGLDPECTGPLDDDEATFGTGRDDVSQACQDCFWDDDSDPTNDGCVFPRSCTDPTFTSEETLACTECSVTPRCQSQCEQRTPNGCDCFGCCTVTRPNGAVIHVLLEGEGCSEANVADEQACKRCTPNALCRKDCGQCELCLGRKPRDLPKSCKGRGNNQPEQTPTCEDGEPPCSATQACPSPIYYCQLGCCLVRVL